MNCTGCHSEIPTAVKFCPECGTRVAACCRGCNAELLPNAPGRGNSSLAGL